MVSSQCDWNCVEKEDSCITVVEISAGSAINAMSSTTDNDAPWCKIHGGTADKEESEVTQFTMGVQDGALGCDILQGRRRKLNRRPFDDFVAGSCLKCFMESFLKFEDIDVVF